MARFIAILQRDDYSPISRVPRFKILLDAAFCSIFRTNSPARILLTWKGYLLLRRSGQYRCGLDGSRHLRNNPELYVDRPDRRTNGWKMSEVPRRAHNAQNPADEQRGWRSYLMRHCSG